MYQAGGRDATTSLWGAAHVNRLGLGILDKATGVDHDDVSVVGMVGDFKPTAVEVAKQDLTCASQQCVVDR